MGGHIAGSAKRINLSATAQVIIIKEFLLASSLLIKSTFKVNHNGIEYRPPMFK